MRSSRIVGLMVGLGSFMGCAGVTPGANSSTHTTVAPGPSETSALAKPSPTTTTPIPVFRTFSIYTDRLPRHTHYAPSGYMGDSDLTMSGAYIQTPNGSQGPCLRVYYKATGPKGWAGIYWQDPANNWGDVPGKAGYDLHGAQKLTFWARGENGGERVHEFRIGGIVGQYPDSDVASLSNVKLSRDWKKYSIDLRKRDLRHIIGGFCFLVLKAENGGGATFYIDDIMYEGPEGAVTAAAPVAVSTAPLLGTSVSQVAASSTPVISTATAPSVPIPAPLPLPTVQPKDLVVKQTDAGLRVSFSSRILFATGKSLLAEGSARVLNQLVSLLNAYPNNRVLIEGHTDNTGNAEFNLKLSELRAKSIRDYLIKQGGFAEKRFDIVGYGATRPVADNGTPSGRSLNRRVEVTILKNEK